MSTGGFKVRTLIIGIGNPIAGEDSFGIHVAKKLEEILESRQDIHVDYCIESGIRLAEKIIGYDRVILVDAVNLSELDKPKLVVLDVKDWNDTVFKPPLSPHDIDFLSALRIMEASFKDEIPKEIIVVSYVPSDEMSFTDRLPEHFFDYVNKAVKTILNVVNVNEDSYR